MQREPCVAFTSPYVVLPAENIDTDQIIPARFLTTTTRTGLGRLAFHDWRYRQDGTPDPAFPLNQPGAGAARILAAGRNFGCGSSREHAVWALLDAGIRAIVSEEFADIFFHNALGNGLLPIAVPAPVADALIRGPADVENLIRVDLAAQKLGLPGGGSVPFSVPPFARHCLLNGLDDLGHLLQADGDIGRYEAAQPAGIHTGVVVSA